MQHSFGGVWDMQDNILQSLSAPNSSISQSSHNIRNLDMLSNQNLQILKDIHTTGPHRSQNNISSDEEEDDGNITDDKRARYDDNITDGGISDSKAQDTVDRRRERNRLLARKTRQRKKVFYEALQRQVAQLVKENEILRGIVETRKMTERSPPVMPAPIKDSSLASTLGDNDGGFLERADYRLVSTIQASQRAFVITNPLIPDNPIVYASKGFLDLTRYRLDQVLGRNCRFLQGPGTDKRQIEILRKGMALGLDSSAVLLNYRADGSTFYNQVFVAPLRDKAHKIVNFVGVQVEVEVLLQTVADTKRASLPVKPEKKDFKDEEKDQPIFLEPAVLEKVKAPNKPTSNKRHLDQENFDFDAFL